MKPGYCIYCHINTDGKTFIRHDYKDYLCNNHKDKVTVPDARNLLHIDDGIDLDKEGDMIHAEIMEEQSRETHGAMKRSYRQIKRAKYKRRIT